MAIWYSLQRHPFTIATTNSVCVPYGCSSICCHIEQPTQFALNVLHPLPPIVLHSFWFLRWSCDFLQMYVIPLTGLSVHDLIPRSLIRSPFLELAQKIFFPLFQFSTGAPRAIHNGALSTEGKKKEEIIRDRNTHYILDT